MSELPVSLSDVKEWIFEYQQKINDSKDLIEYYWNKYSETLDLSYECREYVADVKGVRKDLKDEMDRCEEKAEMYKRRLDDDMNTLKILYNTRKKFSNGRRR